MAGKNRYYRRSKISEARLRQVVRLFAMDVTATDTAELSGLSLRSTNTIYQRILVRMAQACAAQSPYEGELQADKSYFGPNRICGKRGRGAGSKAIVFSLLKRGNCVYTEIVPDASNATLQAIICCKVDPNSVIHTDGWRVITAWWISGLIGISGSIMETMNLSGAQSMSMELSPSGAMPSIAWLSSM